MIVTLLAWFAALSYVVLMYVWGLWGKREIRHLSAVMTIEAERDAALVELARCRQECLEAAAFIPLNRYLRERAPITPSDRNHGDCPPPGPVHLRLLPSPRVS